jgi:WhiB family redox-sensing transcriptional regulator
VRSTEVVPGPILVPVAEEWDWQLGAACRGAELSVFFHPDRERGLDRRRRVETAKAICATCPVLAQCRRHALRVGEPYGTWGGLSESERRQHGMTRPWVR